MNLEKVNFFLSLYMCVCIYIYIYNCVCVKYGSGIYSAFPCNYAMLQNMPSLHHCDILSQLFGQIVTGYFCNRMVEISVISMLSKQDL